jgi:hypothetical protein
VRHEHLSSGHFSREPYLLAEAARGLWTLATPRAGAFARAG